MSQVSNVLRDTTFGYLFWCPGCDGVHHVNTRDGNGPVWGFNGNVDKPTFTPSVLVRWNERDVPKVCHSFVTDGRIRFLSDCTHSLTDQTVDLPAFQHDRWGTP